jgi:hypothetical protein
MTEAKRKIKKTHSNIIQKIKNKILLQTHKIFYPVVYKFLRKFIIS